MPNGLIPGGGLPGELGGGMAPDPMGDTALQALGDLRPKSPNPTVAMQRVDQALDLIHKLIMAVIPQVTQWSPKAVKDLHQMGRTAQSVRSELRKEITAGPPPDLFLGMGGAGPTGGPAPGATTPY